MSSAAAPSGTYRLAVGLAIVVGAITTSLVVGSWIHLTPYESGAALAESCMGGLSAGLVVAAMHPRHRALRLVVATAALAVAAAMTLAVLGQRTHLEAAEREAPVLVGVDRERRLVHAASGASIPMRYELTPVPGTEDLAASVEGGDARSMIAWAWTTPGGVVSWTMTLLRTPPSTAGFEQHVEAVLDGARDSGMTLDDVFVGDRVARASGSVRGIPRLVRIDSFTAHRDGAERHWSSQVAIIDADTTAAATHLDGLRVP